MSRYNRKKHLREDDSNLIILFSVVYVGLVTTVAVLSRRKRKRLKKLVLTLQDHLVDLCLVNQKWLKDQFQVYLI